MLKRKIEQKLTDWKNTPDHKPLIIKGCRQCGKTFSVLDFAKKSGCYNVTLNVWALNENAKKFYENCGLSVLKIGMEKIL